MYAAKHDRYATMRYNRCGKSGLKLPAVALGLWQNFGSQGCFATMEKMIHTAFDLGVVHFDLANNYGAPYGGSAEENFGRILSDMRSYRDEMCISTKAGYGMWPGPYGDRNGSRKYLISSLDQSLGRMGLEYVDIFYHHATDPDTPIEETALALDQIVRSGKALYIGISNYNRAQTEAILKIFRELRVPFVVNQPSYAMLNRWVEHDGLDTYALSEGFGLAVYSPLYQGLLTDRYLNGIPADSRAGKGNEHLRSLLNEKMLAKLGALNSIAAERGQTLSQLALSWVLHNPAVTTVITGASSPQQVAMNAACVGHLDFADEEIAKIEEILK
ncbi:MAG: aldo/keto reductase [Clostridia bacterium]|nr:aldo/keto reductase [Clostridia bacterium]